MPRFGGWRVGDPVVATDSGLVYEIGSITGLVDGMISVGLFEVERPARYTREGGHTLRLFDRVEALGSDGVWPPALIPAARRRGSAFRTMSLSSPALPHALEHRQSRFCYRDERWAFEIRWDNASCEFVFWGYERIDCGVKYFSARRLDGVMDRFLAQLALHGVYWERPYILGASRSHGRGPCELALLRNFSERHQLGADTVYAWAYPGAPLPDWEEIMLAAEWHGVVYPERWDQWSLRALLAALAPVEPRLIRTLAAIRAGHETDAGAA